MTWLQISCPLIQEVKSQGGGIWAAGQKGGKIVDCVGFFRGQTRLLPVGAHVHCSFTHGNLHYDARWPWGKLQSRDTVHIIQESDQTNIIVQAKMLGSVMLHFYFPECNNLVKSSINNPFNVWNWNKTFIAETLNPVLVNEVDTEEMKTCVLLVWSVASLNVLKS